MITVNLTSGEQAALIYAIADRVSVLREGEERNTTAGRPATAGAFTRQLDNLASVSEKLGVSR